MKRGAPRHPKTVELSTTLNLPLYATVGLLEMLFHFTAEFARSGDIGKYSNSVITDYMGWKDDPDVLIDAMLASCWIDACTCHRLRVHDWPDHADQTVKRVLVYNNQEFIKCYGNASTKQASSQDHNSCLTVPLTSPILSNPGEARERARPQRTSDGNPPGSQGAEQEKTKAKTKQRATSPEPNHKNGESTKPKPEPKPADEEPEIRILSPGECMSIKDTMAAIQTQIDANVDYHSGYDEHWIKSRGHDPMWASMTERAVKAVEINDRLTKKLNALNARLAG